MGAVAGLSLACGGSSFGLDGPDDGSAEAFQVLGAIRECEMQYRDAFGEFVAVQPWTPRPSADVNDQGVPWGDSRALRELACDLEIESPKCAYLVHAEGTQFAGFRAWAVCNSTRDGVLAHFWTTRSPPVRRATATDVERFCLELGQCEERGRLQEGDRGSEELRPSVEPPRVVPEMRTFAASDYTVTGSGLKYVDIRPCGAPTPRAGQIVKAEYTGWLTDGTMFDSSYDRTAPIAFSVGNGQVIKGWDEALLTMSVGCRRFMVIPWALAYGEKGRPPVIPPKADLVFDIDLVTID